MSEILLECTRGDLVESVLRGHLAVVDCYGNLIAYCGDPEAPTFIRSSSKPIQAVVLFESGAVDRFGIDGPLLAVCCSSHHGEPGHVAAISRVLALAQVGPEALQCGVHPPVHRPSAAALFCAGVKASEVHNLCAGNHAALLAACRAIGADISTYLNAEHPVQQMILRIVSALSGVPADKIWTGIEDCNAPAHGLPVSGIARAFAALASPESAPAYTLALERIAAAITTYPWYVSGTIGDDLSLMRRSHGRLIVKSGGDGLLCVSVPHAGIGLCIKSESGRNVRTHAIAVETLRQLGLLTEQDVEDMGEIARPILRNHCQVITGEARPAFRLHRI